MKTKKCSRCKLIKPVIDFYKTPNGNCRGYCKVCLINSRPKKKNSPPKDLPNEVWKDIQGYEGLYKVSNKSRIKSMKNEKILSSSNKRGYISINLRKDKKRKCHKLHRLIAKAFIPNPNNKPEINHKNGIKHDNRIENLEWCSRQENIKHAVDTGLIKSGEEKSTSKLTKKEVIYIRESITSKKENTVSLAKKLKVKNSTIISASQGRTWKHLNKKYPPTKPKIPLFKKVVDTVSMRVYNSIKEAYLELNIPYSYPYLTQMLSGKENNKTTLKYIDE